MAKSTYDPDTRTGEHATFVLHTSVVGIATRGEPIDFTHRQPVRKFQIRQPQKYAQYRVSVCISFTRPGKRSSEFYTALPNDITYFTIENDTGTIYDSRTEVPCDMEKFEATRQRFMKEWQHEGYKVVA